jgi:hypothetical protein
MKMAGRPTRRNESKRATENAKKKYLESICDQHIEFHRTGHYDVPGDALKLLGEDSLKIMTQLINSTYGTGEWPNDVTEVTVNVSNKKPKATACSDHTTISLITHTAKIVAIILRRRIERKIEDVLREDKFQRKRKLGMLLGC